MNDSTLIQNLTNKLDDLQLTIDSLKHVNSISQLSYEVHEKQNIITQINEFYDSAWLKLIIVISILGVLVPIIAQYFQRKNLKDLTEFIRKQMNDNYENKLNELKSYNKQEIEKRINELNTSINSIETKNKNLFMELDASTYYLQGRASVLDKNYVLAIASFLKSADHYLKTERPERANVQFVNLKLCLKSINKREIIENTNNYLKGSSYKLTLEEMIDFFHKHPLKSIYEKQLEGIINELDRIKNVT